MTLPKRAGFHFRRTRPNSPGSGCSSAAGTPSRSVEQWKAIGSIKFKRGQLLGRGTFGEVYQALTPSGELVAVKQVPMAAKTREDLTTLDQVQKEIRVLARLRHPNIVNLLAASYDREGERLNIVMEYVPGKSLTEVLRAMGPFEERIIRNYTRQILVALDYCHSQGVIHRDLKGLNILLDSSGFCKLADFGSAKMADNVIMTSAPSISYSYTPGFVAPEVLTSRYNSKVDIWSLGCTIIEMATARDPWSERRFDNLQQFLYTLGQPDSLPRLPTTLSPVAMDFLKQCLNRDYNTRPDTKTLLSHQWMLDEEREMSSMTSVEVVTEDLDALRAELVEKVSSPRPIRARVPRGEAPPPPALVADAVPASPFSEAASSAPAAVAGAGGPVPMADSVSSADSTGSVARFETTVPWTFAGAQDAAAGLV